MTQVTFRQDGKTLTALLSGEIDHHGAAQLRAAIDDRIAAASPAILILDFSAVTFMDSAGIGLILGGVTLAARGPFLSLYNLEPDAVAYARQFMAVIAVIWPFSLLEMVGMVGILRAGGDGQTGFYSDIVIMWMICIPLAALAAFVWSAPPVVVVAILKTIIALEAIVGVLRIRSMKWIKDLTRHE